MWLGHPRTLAKLGARVTISVRRVKLALASSCPQADVFAMATRRLCDCAAMKRRRDPGINHTGTALNCPSRQPVETSPHDYISTIQIPTSNVIQSAGQTPCWEKSGLIVNFLSMAHSDSKAGRFPLHGVHFLHARLFDRPEMGRTYQLKFHLSPSLSSGSAGKGNLYQILDISLITLLRTFLQN